MTEYLNDKTFKKIENYFVKFEVIHLRQKIFVLPCKLSTDESSPNEKVNYDNLISNIKSKSIYITDFFEFKCDVQKSIDKNDSSKTSYEFLKNICNSVEEGKLDLLAVLSTNKCKSEVDVNNIIPINVGDDQGGYNKTQSQKMSAIRISDFTESNVQDPAEWIAHSTFLMDTVGLSETQQIAKLCAALSDVVLRSAVISKVQNTTCTIANFKEIFLELTFKDKSMYLKELQLVKFNEGTETAVQFFRKLQRLVCKSLHKDLTHLGDEVVNLMTATRLRNKLPDYITNDSGFLTYPTEDINLAKFADKLLVSRSLNNLFVNKTKSTDFSQSTELNSLVQNLVNAQVKEAWKNNDKFAKQKSDKFGNPNKAKSQFKGNCYFCGKPNHSWNKCYKLKNSQAKGSNMDWKPNRGEKNKTHFNNKGDKTSSINIIETTGRRACTKSTIVEL